MWIYKFYVVLNPVPNFSVIVSSVSVVYVRSVSIECIFPRVRE